MKNLKFALIGVGVVGIISMFALPFVKFGPISFTMWKISKIPGAPGGFFWIPLLGFLATAAMGGMAAAKGGVEKWMAGVAAGGSALAVIWILKEGDIRKAAGIGYWIIILCGIAGSAIGGTLAAKGEEG